MLNGWGRHSLPAQSFVSPVCIEGNARYVEFMELVGQASLPAGEQAGSTAPLKAAGPRWYANLPLEDAGDTTTATAAFQNGALEVPMSVKWMPYNLVEHDGATITIRKGDALRLTCIDPERATEDAEFATGGQFELAIDVSGNTYSSPNTRPITVAFTNAGSSLLSAGIISKATAPCPLRLRSKSSMAPSRKLPPPASSAANGNGPSKACLRTSSMKWTTRLNS